MAPRARKGGGRLIRFSIVIPCRNERPRLEACLDALEVQDHPRRQFEIVIVDGGSTDGCGALALRRGVQLLTDEGKGPAAARNIGIRASRGEIVAFTDADCVPRYDWLTRLGDAFDADPDVGAIAGGLRLPRASLLGRLEDNDARLHYRGYITSNIAYRRAVLDALGGFDEMLRCAEDYDLAWRALDAGYRIEHEPRAIVLHDPPEVEEPLAGFLRKQFWYARHDVPAHARAVRRSWRARTALPGSALAVAGLADALQNSTWTMAAGLGLALRSRALVGGALAGATIAGARHASQAVASVGEGERELPRMAIAEGAKRLVRGAGTLVGLAELALPRTWRALRSAEPSPWTPASAASPRLRSAA